MPDIKEKIEKNKAIYTDVVEKASKLKEKSQDIVTKGKIILDDLNNTEKIFVDVPEILNNPVWPGSVVPALDAMEEAGLSINNQLDQSEQVMGGTAAVTGSFTSTSSAVLLTSIYVAKAEKPEYEPALTEEKINFDLRELIGSPLKELNKNFTNMLDGAFHALEDAKNPHRLSQASGSMRELLKYFVNHFSPDEEVIKAKWYVKPEKGNTTWRQRVRYAFVKDDEKNQPKEILDNADYFSTQVQEIYGFLSSTLKNKKGFYDEDKMEANIKSYFVLCQNLIKEILKANGLIES